MWCPPRCCGSRDTGAPLPDPKLSVSPGQSGVTLPGIIRLFPAWYFGKGRDFGGKGADTSGGFTGLCVPFSDAKGLAAPQSVSPGSTEITKEELPDSFHLAASSSEDLPTLWKAVSSSQSIRALGATDIQKWKVRAVSRWSKA